MKSIASILVIISGFFIVASCTKEIEVDLNSSDPQVVIEGLISNGQTAYIKITESINFDESNSFPTVENAIVMLTDDFGNIETLIETSPGIYETITLIGAIGRTYYLSVDTGTKQLSSASTLPNLVSFDSLYVQQVTTTGGGGPGGGGSGGGTSYEVTVKYKDPIGVKNYYRFVEYVNGNYQTDYIFDDRLADGLLIENELLSFNRVLHTNDTLTIEMQSIDPLVYDYFNSFGNLIGGPQSSSTPANPYTNITGSVLGYFSAHSKEVRTIIIQ